MSSMPIIALACGLAIVSLIFAFWSLARAQRVQKELLAKLQVMEQSVSAATSSAIGMGGRIVNLEKKLHGLQQAHLTQPDADSALYTQAMQLFDSGADVNAVVASCGISNSEASLMALIRQKTQRPLSAAQA